MGTPDGRAGSWAPGQSQARPRPSHLPAAARDLVSPEGSGGLRAGRDGVTPHWRGCLLWPGAGPEQSGRRQAEVAELAGKRVQMARRFLVGEAVAKAI